MALEQELTIAAAAVRLASTICQSVQSKITTDVLEKKDRSPVTIADFASQAVVCRALQSAFPDDPVIGEEDSVELRGPDGSAFSEKIQAEVNAVGVAADHGQICDWIDRGGAKEHSDRFWTLDPIDGTKGFLRGEQYAVALALIEKGEITLAVLGCPNLAVKPGGEEAGTLCMAIKGQGSQTEPLASPDQSASANVTTNSAAGAARFCESVESGHSSHGHSAQIAELLGINLEPVRLDSQAKYAVVGRGEADIYMRLPTRPGYVEKIWDHAAGVLFVEEAGGRATDIHGKPLEFSHGFQLSANRGVIVTNGVLHDEVINAVREVGVE